MAIGITSPRIRPKRDVKFAGVLYIIRFSPEKVKALPHSAARKSKPEEKRRSQPPNFASYPRNFSS